MSWILGIDSSSTCLSVALLCEDKPAFSFVRWVKNSHAEHITEVMRSLFSQANIGRNDISHCGIVSGPGSFTGLRVGLAFVKGLFVMGETKILPISSLENAAWMLAREGQTLGIALDARQGNCFFARFTRTEGLLVRLDEDRKMTISECLSCVESCDMLLYDDMGFPTSELQQALHQYPHAVSVQELPFDRGLSAAKKAYACRNTETYWDEAVNISPNYMQASYAERVQEGNI